MTDHDEVIREMFEAARIERAFAAYCYFGWAIQKKIAKQKKKAAAALKAREGGDA